jgi:outer membrane lipoprotein-sorting protein
MLPFLPVLPLPSAPQAQVQAPPQSQALPAWWGRWRQTPAFKSTFAQEGESSAFGKLTKTGTILAAKGGRLRIEYDGGALLLSDGRQITQYDPSTRTAQQFEIEGIMDEWPMLRLLLDPMEIDRAFDIKSMGDGRIALSPKRQGLPEVALEGRGDFLSRIEWKDATGARQVLALAAPKAVANPKGASFAFDPPRGTKWVK